MSDKTNIEYSIRYYLSERFRLRFEDAGLEDMMDEEAAQAAEQATAGIGAEKADPEDKGVEVSSFPNDDAAIAEMLNSGGAIRTLDGELAGDEFASDAVNYQLLLNKIDGLLDRLKLDA